MSVFDKAKQSAGTGSAKKADNKETLTLAPEYNEALARLLQAKKDKKSAEAVVAALEADLKPAVTTLFAMKYEELKRNPGTCQLVTADGQTACKVIVKDQYADVDGDTRKLIAEQYGEDIVEEKTVYSFNPELLEKHMTVIASLIENSNIPQEDKDNLIEATTKLTIRKGIIDQANSYGNVGQFLSYIRPVTVIQ